MEKLADKNYEVVGDALRVKELESENKRLTLRMNKLAESLERIERKNENHVNEMARIKAQIKNSKTNKEQFTQIEWKMKYEALRGTYKKLLESHDKAIKALEKKKKHARAKASEEDLFKKTVKRITGQKMYEKIIWHIQNS
jgi:chromosome segregation ATPase